MTTKTLTKRLLLLVIVLLVANLCAASSQPRPETWAQPIQSKCLKNFYKLNDQVYRSAQPDEEAFGYLRSLGMKNILNLRNSHNDDPDVTQLGLKLHRVTMDAGKIEPKDVVAALRIIKQSDGPILIHCRHGSDRTGTICAMYRIVFQNWSKEDAIDELLHGGYGYHALYKNIPEYIRQENIEAMKKKVFAP